MESQSNVRRIFIEKKDGFNLEAVRLMHDLKMNLGIRRLNKVRILNRYDIEGISEDVYKKSINTIFCEMPVDTVSEEEFRCSSNSLIFAVEYLPGQYDVRADSAMQCVQILTQGEHVDIKVAKIIVLSGNVTDDDFIKIKKYCINPVESREASLDKPETLATKLSKPDNIKVIAGFTDMDDTKIRAYMDGMGFAMSLEDLKFCQTYFRDEEKRNPYATELKVIDTYWSDHCRHTTFLTEVTDVKFEEGKYSDIHKKAYEEYLSSRDYVYTEKVKPVTLMDIATVAAKELRKRGKLNDLDISEEINACSINVDVDVNGQKEEWLVMFKNETHNHPTEIEPFGGAATCLGGAIRDPLSGRSYVYQAMRVTGSGDPRTKVEDTMSGKLPQRKITTGAAIGYSSYGNQIGLATGQVVEIYDEGYVAKRMEIGAVIGAAPKENVIREIPVEGDLIILLGGRTGRDGCGGATGSSREHDELSLQNCGAQVQKGNAPTERKIQRLFKKKNVSTMIKRCNDFGAGGVSVAIGELADSLDIDLDSVPKKYDGLDGTELAISESQERMAVVVNKKDAAEFIKEALIENLEATIVAKVTNTNRLRMKWRHKFIVDVSRDFLNTNGVSQQIDVVVKAANDECKFFEKVSEELDDTEKDIEAAWVKNLRRLNVCSQKGLVEMFDSSIGAGTVLMPFGGKNQYTPSLCMVAKIPVTSGDTMTSTAMAFGYNPVLSKMSPFHGAVYAVVESIAKIVTVGGDYKKARLTFQEFFEKPGKDPEKWGTPFASLLGAHYAQKKLKIPAIGGKDSMSGSFKDMGVPPTLVSFAVSIVDARNVISPEFKAAGNNVAFLPLKLDEYDVPDFEYLDKMYEEITSLIKSGKIKSVHTIGTGGIAEAISKMAFGNGIGFRFSSMLTKEELFLPHLGSFVVEIQGDVEIDQLLNGLSYKMLGSTTAEGHISVSGKMLRIDKLIEEWKFPLESIFPMIPPITEINSIDAPVQYNYNLGKADVSFCLEARPRVFIPVFPGTNCECDTARAFENAGADCDVFVFRNLTPSNIEDSLKEMAQKINKAQIIMIPGGFSAADEPDGSGKFIANIFRNPYVSEVVMDLIKNRDGLVLGICNGFQALIKLGLLPYGDIRDIDATCPTLTYNTIGRHVSTMIRTRVSSNLSPWLSESKLGEVHTIAVSHGEGRFIASPEMLDGLGKNGQIATQYVDLDGMTTYNSKYNPNGSVMAIESITDATGRIFGKMGHNERIGSNKEIMKNIPGEKDQKIFLAGVKYFR